MSDDKKPTLGRRPLGLKTSVEAGEVKQTFSHGRTNKVVVEVKRRKLELAEAEAKLSEYNPPVFRTAQVICRVLTMALVVDT